MSTPPAASGLALAWRVLRAEGVVAFRDRLLDRLAARRRRSSFKVAATESASGEWPAGEALADVAVLNVLATAPRGDFGGVQVQLLRRLAAEAEHRPWALLYPDRGGYRLEIEADGRRWAVIFEAPAPPAATSLADEGFERVVRRAARRVGARAVHFEQLAGWPLASVAELAGDGLKRVLSVHDFGLFCLRPHLLEQPQDRFCDYSRDAARCHRCLRRDWDVDGDFQDRRRAVASQLLRSADAVIYPSDFLRRTYREILPASAAEHCFVVEPPSLGRAPATAGGGARGGGRHVAYVGSVQPHKGALVFERLIDSLQPAQLPGLRWSVYGGGDAEILARLRRRGVRVRGYYRADELPGLLRRDRVDLALLLSIWPEAYALTFDECLRAGVPVLAFDHGAVADRLRRTGGGELVSLEAGVEGVAQRLRRMLERPPGAAVAGFELPDAGGAAAAVLGIYRQLGLI